MMSSFSTWTGTKNKPLTKVHVRPKRYLYSKLREQPKSQKREQNVERNVYNSEDTTTLNFFATDDSEEEIVTYELSAVNSVRIGNSSRAECDQRNKQCVLATTFVEKILENGDTLHNLALRYGCKVSEMKRINNLINDQEFHGLRKIKVPVKEHGFAKEQLEKENEQRKKSLTNVSFDMGTNAMDASGARLISIRNNQDAKEFLQQMDADLERIRKSTKTEKDSLEEVTMSLTCKRFHPFSQNENRKNKPIPTLRVLILVIILALIAFPIVFLLLMVYRRAAEASHVNSTHFQKLVAPS